MVAFAKEDEDDMPPPLEDMSERLLISERIRAQTQTQATTTAAAASIRSADISSRKQAPLQSNGSAIRRGFFYNPKPAKVKLKPQLKEDKGSEIPFIKAMKGAGTNSAKIIPDFMRVDQQANSVEKLKKQMIDALSPTPAVMSRVLSDPALLSGFDDPEVMSAVADISRDPSTLTSKYRNNTKVAAFYRQVAGLVAGRLEDMSLC